MIGQSIISVRSRDVVIIVIIVVFIAIYIIVRLPSIILIIFYRLDRRIHLAIYLIRMV